AMGGRTAVAALMAALDDPDRRVRRAAALALGESGDLSTAAALRQTIENDQAEDVTAVAARSLGRLHAPGARGFLLQQLERDSRWWNSIRLGALLGLDELEDASLAPTFRAYTDARYQRQVRVAALEAWFHAAPGDQGLATRLRELVDDRNRNLRGKALELLGKLHRADDAAFLEDFAAREPDPNLALAAREALDEIQAFAGRQGETH
ncbi:MAG: HEAT repeat domain-containing protein, partial [Terriglobia bacterium]